MAKHHTFRRARGTPRCIEARPPNRPSRRAVARGSRSQLADRWLLPSANVAAQALFSLASPTRRMDLVRGQHRMGAGVCGDSLNAIGISRPLRGKRRCRDGARVKASKEGRDELQGLRIEKKNGLPFSAHLLKTVADFSRLPIQLGVRDPFVVVAAIPGVEGNFVRLRFRPIAESMDKVRVRRLFRFYSRWVFQWSFQVRRNCSAERTLVVAANSRLIRWGSTRPTPGENRPESKDSAYRLDVATTTVTVSAGRLSQTSCRKIRRSVASFQRSPRLLNRTSRQGACRKRDVAAAAPSTRHRH